jgi:hypothetical protein
MKDQSMAQSIPVPETTNREFGLLLVALIGGLLLQLAIV